VHPVFPRRQCIKNNFNFKGRFFSPRCLLFFFSVSLQLASSSFKSGGASTSTTAPATQGPPARSISKKKVSKKEEASKARLQELIDQYAPKK
jgi:hypothetical protein